MDLQSEQQQAILELPTTIQTMLIERLKNLPDSHISYLSASFVNELLQATGYDKSELGLTLLPLASSYSIAPVSSFQVGAVAFDGEGNAYFGANFEFSGTHIGQTIHAEQSAIAHMWQRNAKDLSLLVINYPPCGHCRQFINEVNLTDDFLIQLPDSQAKPLEYYLPASFGGDDLGIDTRILGNVSQNCSQVLEPFKEYNNEHTIERTIERTIDALVQLAEQVHDVSHAPYSGSKSGIALLYPDGEVVTGRYAENAAFNPSLPALQVALNFRRMQGKNWRNIEHAVMVETVTTLKQSENARSLLATFCEVVLKTMPR